MQLSHFVDAQSASRSNHPAGCSASLYAAARLKANVGRKRLVATAMTECLLAMTSLQRQPFDCQTVHQVCTALKPVSSDTTSHTLSALRRQQLLHWCLPTSNACQEVQPLRGLEEPNSGSFAEVSDQERKRDLRRSIILIRFVLLDSCQGGRFYYV